MPVRLATIADVPRMVELGRRFFDETELGRVMEYDPASALATFENMLSSEYAAVFLIEKDGVVVGGVGAVIAPHYFNFSCRTCQEFFWYVAPESRGGREALRLIAAVKEWARGKGVTLLALAHMSTSPEGVATLYEREGLRQMETYYLGRI